MAKSGLKFSVRASDVKSRLPQVRRARHGPRKIACLGGAGTLKFAPWKDESWELWAHASCRHLCKRDPDLLWDLHPPELWRHPEKKTWDPKYLPWLQHNHLPIMMQDRYPDVPGSIRYPIETVLTEFRGYLTNHLAFMIAFALMEGVTQLAIFGCDYGTNTEYGPQRGSAEYWLGVAEGRGVQVFLPTGCDLLNKPHLLYGYESHPGGKRDPSYEFSIGPFTAGGKAPQAHGLNLTPVADPGCPPLRNIGVPPDPDAFTKAFPEGAPV